MEKEQKSQLLAQINKALSDNDMPTAIKLAQQYPMPPQVATALRVGFGTEWLKDSGFNLVEAERFYGQDWLNREISGSVSVS